MSQDERRGRAGETEGEPGEMAQQPQRAPERGEMARTCREAARQRAAAQQTAWRSHETLVMSIEHSVLCPVAVPGVYGERERVTRPK